MVFLGGFRSDMTGTKATFLEAWAKARGRAFLRFDYTGHGASSGDFLDGTIGGWAEDAQDAVERLTEGPQVLVGSSMGGWIALLLAARLPGRVAGLVGVAAAPDFTEDAMWAGMDAATRARLAADGRIEVPSEYDDAPYPDHPAVDRGRAPAPGAAARRWRCRSRCGCCTAAPTATSTWRWRCGCWRMPTARICVSRS